MVHDNNDKWENITVSRNCPVDWNSMKGDEKIRFCGKCNQSVYNLSEMTQEQAEEIIRQQNGDMCIRMYRRPDGKIMTKDCPKPVIRPSVWVAGGAAAACILSIAAYALAVINSSTQEVQGRMRYVPCEADRLRTKVVYTVKDIRAGEKIAADSIEERDVEKSKAPIDCVHNYSEVVGKVVNYDVEAGSLISTHTIRK
jgi:flagella basal body P-ring formation protein FlgA